MKHNPYRRDADLNAPMKWIGGMLFITALATPFMVIKLVGQPTEVALALDKDATIDKRAPSDLVAPSAADVRPAAAAHAGSIDVATTDALASSQSVVSAPQEKMHAETSAVSQPRAVRTPGAPRLPHTDEARLGPRSLGTTLAPRLVPALALGRSPDNFALPVPIASESPEAAERQLDLSRSQRREIQLRLSLLGYDPGGADGIIGKQTRSAIRLGQAHLSLPETGYIDSRLLRRLEYLTEAKLAAHRSKWAAISADQRKARAITPTPKAPECRRSTDGRITENQSFSCDLQLLEESLEGMFKRDS